MGVGKMRWMKDGTELDVHADSWDAEGLRRCFLEEPGTVGEVAIRVLGSRREVWEGMTAMWGCY